MKALVFGQTGQVATELARRAGRHGITLETLGRAEADLNQPEICAEHIAGTDADIIINAAAYTAVDKAESEPELAMRVNADAPGAMARAAAARGLPFLHISTDYVFDGSGAAPFRETDATGPLGVYGESKLAGEARIAAAGGWHAILRTSWVFSAHGANFVKTMLRLSETRDRLTIVADQRGGPTPAAAIADALLEISAKGTGRAGGIFHFSGAPDASWADFARAIFRLAGRNTEVIDIPTSDFPTPAARPLNSRLDCTRLEQIHGIARPDWQAHLRDVLAELGALAETGR